MGEKRNAYRILVGKPEERALGRPMRRWEDNIKNGIRDLGSLYFSPSIIRMINSRRMRWAGHIARMWEKRNAYRILVRKPEGNTESGKLVTASGRTCWLCLQDRTTCRCRQYVTAHTVSQCRRAQ
jgi:hypothetical protein